MAKVLAIFLSFFSHFAGFYITLLSRAVSDLFPLFLSPNCILVKLTTVFDSTVTGGLFYLAKIADVSNIIAKLKKNKLVN